MIGPPIPSVRNSYDSYGRGYSVTPKLKVWGVIDSHSLLVDAQI